MCILSNKEQMLKDISIVDFILVEFALYLDTHPTDRNAMEYFNHYSRMKNQMVKEFSQKYFPLTKDLAESNKEWRWGAAPLPWEGACG
ncbi:MAG TPA: spore coat protein CotJB [Candidatus Acetatifactor stercoripullorum]|uniref:Spore coat protein CotJB n=1 Tax=Candidatus Acetatifactor stercoripullorum TaxID=2838414 RepID=A0A9D1R312_9FIRM|nr:spore coat protein CotJB [Candidatus Acetatifactor stercoripullorum]